MFTLPRRAGLLLSSLVALAIQPATAWAQPKALELLPGDTVVFLGNTLAERLQHFNHFETLLIARFPLLKLRVRNLGWSGDTIVLQPRPLNFGDAAQHLHRQKTDVIFAFFGFNESFDGEPGIGRFEADLDSYLKAHLAARYNGRTPPRIVLVSPIAHERLPRLKHVDAEARNRELERYTAAMHRVASRHPVTFVDLFTPTRKIMTEGSSRSALTVNGIHLTEAGDAVVGQLLMQALGFAPPARESTSAAFQQFEALRDDIRQKNQQFFYRWRPLNAEYVVGRRVEPFGSISFPPEMQQLDKMVADLDQRIWRKAAALKGMIPYPLPADRTSTAAAKDRH